MSISQPSSVTPSNITPKSTAIGRWTWFRLALWFGLLTGLSEVGLLAGKRYVLKAFLDVSPMTVWMAPLGYTVIFVVLAAALAVAARRNPRLWLFRSVMAMGILSAFSLLTLFSQLHVAAAAVLSVGLGVQVGRLGRRHETGFVTLVRRTTPLMFFAVLALAIGVHGIQLIRERRADAQLPPAASGTPNVVLIVLDTVRKASIGITRRDRGNTPQLDRIATEGAHFANAIVTAPWTLPSHASMFTGRYPVDLSTSWITPLDDEFATLAEVLASRGYATGGFVANTGYAGWESGLSRGFAHYDDYQITVGQIFRSTAFVRWLRQRSFLWRALASYDVLGRRNAPSVNDAFFDWFTAHDDRPVFAFLNYYDAHAPYFPPDAFWEAFGSSDKRRSPVLVHTADIGEYPAEAVQHELEAYEAAIAYLDSEIGSLVERLDALGALDNTILIVTSDHGEEFDEHGRIGHGNSLYMPALHVPLIIRFPRAVPADATIVTPVSLVDLSATVLDLLGVDDHPLPGTSLVRTWTDGSASSPALSEEDEMQSVLIDGYHYIATGGDPAEELFAIAADAWEQNDLAGTPAAATLLECFREASVERFVDAHRCTGYLAPEGTATAVSPPLRPAARTTHR